MNWLIRLLLLLPSLAAFGQQYDLLIRHGRVIDGTGNPWIYADVGITADRITLVGKAAENAAAKRVIDARGLIINVQPWKAKLFSPHHRHLMLSALSFSSRIFARVVLCTLAIPLDF